MFTKQIKSLVNFLWKKNSYYARKKYHVNQQEAKASTLHLKRLNVLLAYFLLIFPVFPE